VENQQGIDKLFFELASESRINILRQLQKRSWKMHELSQSLDLTSTETFRQLQRLSKESFVIKDADGSYSLTPFGELVLFLSPSFEFIFKYREHFLDYDIWQLPKEFIFRIGELNGGTLKNGLPEVVNLIEKNLKESEEYIWTMTSQVFLAHGRAVEERCKTGVKFRSLHPKDMLPSEMEYPEIKHCIERRYLPKVPTILVITEKEAMVGLPRVGGNLDIIAFFGSDPHFMKWAKDLYGYYWEQGEVLSKSTTT
jgi:predicted transcriptional regulator